MSSVNDNAKGVTTMEVKTTNVLQDKGKWMAKWKITKWLDEATWKSGNAPAEIVDIDGNALENSGINELWTIQCDAPTTELFDNANAYLGVGESSDAFDASDTDLQGASLVWVGMDLGFPTYGTSQKAIWQATFTGLVAGSDVTVTTSGTNTIVGSVDQNSTASWGFTYSGAQTVDVKVIQAGYVPYIVYGLVLAASDSSLPIAQSADRNYQ